MFNHIIHLIEIIILIYTISILTGGIVCSIEQNHLGGVFLFGLRLSYVVGNQEDYDNLVPNRGSPGFFRSLTGSEKYIKITWDLFGLLKPFNLGIYSLNPFARFRKVEIIPTRPAFEGEIKVGSSVEKQIFTPIPIYVNFLRIKSNVLTLFREVELKEYRKIDPILMATILVSGADLDEIYVTQKGHFSQYVFESLKSGVTTIFKKLTFKKFQNTDFSESSTTFLPAMKACISGGFGFRVVKTVISDWTHSANQQPLVDAELDMQAAERESIATKTRAKGEAEAIELKGVAKAATVAARMKAYTDRKVNPDVAAASDAQIESATAFASPESSMTTVVQGNTSGVGINLAAGGASPKPKKPKKRGTP